MYHGRRISRYPAGLNMYKEDRSQLRPISAESSTYNDHDLPNVFLFFVFILELLVLIFVIVLEYFFR